MKLLLAWRLPQKLVIAYATKSSLLRGQCVAQSTALHRQYHEKILDHYENPRNFGSLDVKKKNVGTGLVGAPACGDVMKLQIEVDDDGNIADCKFKTFG